MKSNKSFDERIVGAIEFAKSYRLPVQAFDDPINDVANWFAIDYSEYVRIYKILKFIFSDCC